MQRVLFLLALLAVSSVAVSDKPHGGSWKDVNVTDITAYTTGGPEGKGYLIVTFSSNGTGTPSCASGYPRNLAIAGGFAAAIVQSAFLSQAPLTVTGTGTCDVSPTTETMASVHET